MTTTSMEDSSRVDYIQKEITVFNHENTTMSTTSKEASSRVEYNQKNLSSINKNIEKQYQLILTESKFFDCYYLYFIGILRHVYHVYGRLRHVYYNVYYILKRNNDF